MINEYWDQRVVQKAPVGLTTRTRVMIASLEAFQVCHWMKSIRTIPIKSESMKNLIHQTRTTRSDLPKQKGAKSETWITRQDCGCLSIDSRVEQHFGKICESRKGDIKVSR